MIRILVSILGLAGLAACMGAEVTDTAEKGETIEARSAELNTVVAPDAEIEILAEGFIWPEGPVWVEEARALYFNDVPEN